MESHVAGLAEGLVKRGHEVDMLTSRSRKGLAARQVMTGVEVHRSWMPSRSPLGWGVHTLITFGAHGRLARAADVLHAHTFASAPPALLSRRRFKRPLVLTLHTSHFLMQAKKPLWSGFLRRVIASADYLLATSEEILQVALALCPHPRSEVMTNAVDTERFSPAGETAPTSEPRIIVPRRLFPKNGVEYFVRAMPSIVAQTPVTARIVGDGPERGRLVELARDLGVGDRIEFTGARPNEEMPGLLRWADIAVIPSLMEATSIAALEAMSCAVPVAASSVGGLPEIIDEEVGTLFQPAAPEALARAVIRLLERPDLDRLGREARRRVVDNWSIERMVQRHLDIYNQLIDEQEAQSG